MKLLFRTLGIAVLIVACSIAGIAQAPLRTLQNAAAATGNGTAFDVESYGGVNIQITGTFSATITFETTTDGTNWVARKATNVTDEVSATTATAAGEYNVQVAGATQFRARISAYTSGTVTVRARGTSGSIVRRSSGGGGSGTVNSGVGGQFAYYPSTGTTVDDVAGFSYSATADWTLQGTPASGKTGLLLYEPTATASATIQGAPSLLHLHAINNTAFWAIGYSSDATAYEWANYLEDDGGLSFDVDNGTISGLITFYPQGLELQSISSTYYGGIAEVASDQFGLMLTTSTPTSGATFPLTWRDTGITQLAPAAALADGDLAVNHVHLYLNETADSLNVKWKESGGTVFTRPISSLAASNSSSFAKTTDTTLANITGLTRNVEAGRTYTFRAELDTTAAATGGVKFAVSGTATATSINYSGVLLDGTTVLANTRATALGTTVCAVTTSTAGTCTIKGTIVVNAAGTLTLQFAQNASDAGASTVLVNQSLQLIPIG